MMSETLRFALRLSEGRDVYARGLVSETAQESLEDELTAAVYLKELPKTLPLWLVKSMLRTAAEAGHRDGSPAIIFGPETYERRIQPDTRIPFHVTDGVLYSADDAMDRDLQQVTISSAIAWCAQGMRKALESPTKFALQWYLSGDHRLAQAHHLGGIPYDGSMIRGLQFAIERYRRLGGVAWYPIREGDSWEEAAEDVPDLLSALSGFGVQ